MSPTLPSRSPSYVIRLEARVEVGFRGMRSDDGKRPCNACGPTASGVILRTRKLERRFARTESCLPPGSLALHPELRPPVNQEESDIPQAAASSIFDRSAAAGGRSPPIGGSTTPCATAPTAIACSPPLLGWPGVQCLTRRSTRRSAFADAHATRDHLQQATERGSAFSTLRQVLALQLLCDGQATAAIAVRLGVRSRQHRWSGDRRPPVEAVDHELLMLAHAEFTVN